MITYETESARQANRISELEKEKAALLDYLREKDDTIILWMEKFGKLQRANAELLATLQRIASSELDNLIGFKQWAKKLANDIVKKYEGSHD